MADEGTRLRHHTLAAARNGLKVGSDSATAEHAEEESGGEGEEITSDAEEEAKDKITEVPQNGSYLEYDRAWTAKARDEDHSVSCLCLCLFCLSMINRILTKHTRNIAHAHATHTHSHTHTHTHTHSHTLSILFFFVVVPWREDCLSFLIVSIGLCIQSMKYDQLVKRTPKVGGARTSFYSSPALVSCDTMNFFNLKGTSLRAPTFIPILGRTSYSATRSSSSSTHAVTCIDTVFDAFASALYISSRQH